MVNKICKVGLIGLSSFGSDGHSLISKINDFNPNNKCISFFVIDKTLECNITRGIMRDVKILTINDNENNWHHIHRLFNTVDLILILTGNRSKMNTNDLSIINRANISNKASYYCYVECDELKVEKIK